MAEPERITTEVHEKLEIYKLLVEMADRVSQRRQSANSFYLTINTAIIGGSVLIAHADYGDLGGAIIPLAGILICCLWISAIRTYRTLNGAKFKVITDLEAKLPVQAFEKEWALLEAGTADRKYKPFYKTEIRVPMVFLLLHGAQLGLMITLLCCSSGEAAGS